ncbi:hypothetical protein C1N84_03320 [Pantoea sp. SGAir0418]|nr:hypothetical protein ERD80_15285 [Pantoea sp. R102]
MSRSYFLKCILFFSCAVFSYSVLSAKSNIHYETKIVLQTDEDITVLTVHKAIRDNKLSLLRDHCLAYDYDDVSDSKYFIIDVREDKRYAICGGDPNTSVHLFRFKVDKKNYSLLTDAGSDNGVFHPVKK